VGVTEEYEEEEEGQQQRYVQLPAEDLRNLRKAAKERNDMQAQLNAQQRELAFSKAGLDLSDPKMGYFTKGYEGELTAEAIRATAQEHGFIQGTPPPNQANLNGQQRIANASSGAGETPPPDLQDLIRQAASPEEVMTLMKQAGYATSWDRD
jgi:hypothetical protein